MSNITLTKDNFVSQLPELYDLVMKKKEVIIEDQDNGDWFETAMKDLKTGKNIVDHHEFTMLMEQRGVKSK